MALTDKSLFQVYGCTNINTVIHNSIACNISMTHCSGLARPNERLKNFDNYCLKSNRLHKTQTCLHIHIQHIELSQWKERTCKWTATFVQKCELLFSKRLSEKKKTWEPKHIFVLPASRILVMRLLSLLKLGQAPVTVAKETETRESQGL